MNLLLRVYDYFRSHRAALWTVCCALTALLVIGAAGLRYKEDIADFLPSDSEFRESMEVYSQLNDASRIVIIFEGASADSLCAEFIHW